MNLTPDACRSIRERPLSFSWAMGMPRPHECMTCTAWRQAEAGAVATAPERRPMGRPRGSRNLKPRKPRTLPPPPPSPPAVPVEIVLARTLESAPWDAHRRVLLREFVEAFNREAKREGLAPRAVENIVRMLRHRGGTVPRQRYRWGDTSGRCVCGNRHVRLWGARVLAGRGFDREAS